MIQLVVILGCALVPAAARAAEAQPGERSFPEAFNDVLTDFESDLARKEVPTLKNPTIRSIQMSEGIPASFRIHLETSVSERILRTGKTTVIPCEPCRRRQVLPAPQPASGIGISAVIDEGEALAKAARKLGIQSFLDVSFSYQPTGILLSLSVSDPESGAIVWSRTYNSETSRNAQVRRGIDPGPKTDSGFEDGATPTLQHRISAQFAILPDLAGQGNLSSASSTVLGVSYRLAERYDHKRKEVGFQIEYFRNSTELVSGLTSTTLWRGINLTVLFVHAWNLWSGTENTNAARGSVLVGIGGLFSTGHLNAATRLAYEWRLARHWSFGVQLGWRPNSGVFSGGSNVGNAGGADTGVAVHYLF